ncbi:hypothetical protein EJ08DRAFT_664639 [Tothia fuscella]|uniref:Uncharacterized protein n=1 Tax=Tothia fuscella TaxID=1048955 RepID=A0A9P4NIK2_9PEZI|nr:hypothetical protein EJ08DRAFT_664639 [Tothia fuscella]
MHFIVRYASCVSYEELHPRISLPSLLNAVAVKVRFSTSAILGSMPTTIIIITTLPQHHPDSSKQRDLHANPQENSPHSAALSRRGFGGRQFACPAPGERRFYDTAAHWGNTPLMKILSDLRGYSGPGPAMGGPPPPSDGVRGLSLDVDAANLGGESFSLRGKTMKSKATVTDSASASASDKEEQEKRRRRRIHQHHHQGRRSVKAKIKMAAGKKAFPAKAATSESSSKTTSDSDSTKTSEPSGSPKPTATLCEYTSSPKQCATRI